jgi:hypothetical protein
MLHDLYAISWVKVPNSGPIGNIGGVRPGPDSAFRYFPWIVHRWTLIPRSRQGCIGSRGGANIGVHTQW